MVRFYEWNEIISVSKCFDADRMNENNEFENSISSLEIIITS
jgi:hypothetical protein